jgi:hypothetical protein
MPREYCKCPVDLFGEDQPRQFMGEGHGPKGEGALRLGTGVFRPAVSRAYGEDDTLLAGVPACAQPTGQFLRGEGLPTAVEQNQPSGGTRPLPGDRSEQRLLITKGGSLDGCVGDDTAEIDISGRSKQVFPATLADKRQGELQRQSSYLWLAAKAAMPAPSRTASIMASQPMQELIIMW